MEPELEEIDTTRELLVKDEKELETLLEECNQADSKIRRLRSEHEALLQDKNDLLLEQKRSNEKLKLGKKIAGMPLCCTTF